MDRVVKIVKYPPGYPEAEWGVIERDPETGQVYNVIPCNDYKECEEIVMDLKYPARVNAKLLMYNYHMFDEDVNKAKEKIIRFLEEKIRQAKTESEKKHYENILYWFKKLYYNSS